MFILTLSPYSHADAINDLLTENTAADKSSDNKIISLNHTEKSDRLIEKRLHKIYSEMDDLKGLRVYVSNGIATLEGELDSSASEKKALQFANQMEEVIEVKNNLQVSHNATKRLQKTFTKLTALAEQAISSLPIIFLAFFVFWIFWVTGRWVSNKNSLYRRITINPFIADLLGKIIHLTFIIIGIVLALSLLDATALLGTILGAAGIFGLAIGFAVRDTVENFIASLLLSIRNPFEVNDVVSIDSHQGQVVRLTPRATILLSFDGNHIRIPNATVYKAIITNFSRKPERRFEFDISVGVDQDLSYAQGLVLKTLDEMPGILQEPKCQVIVHELGNSSVIVRIYCWINQQEVSLGKVRSEAIKAVKQAFDEAHIALPNPVYDIHISRDKAGYSASHHQKININNKTAIDHEIQDVAADHTLTQQIDQENVAFSDENLLDSHSEKEL
ncbi:mechanosensitive ion channel protein MscS [Methyloprofundus sedimenti]|uniref:Small-conductance mechanosensitive channel n=1 Tax=Methyloprofundus sedimenti TaxID=1420851 RepID=A0A1V8MAS9_9GAMM|nr:mechanosensitive ion channel protein MscS [Methyloprofundus sedimenti]